MSAPLKFRPSLTIEEIKFLLATVNWSDNPNQHGLMRKLEVFTLKATHGITKPSHVVVGRESLEAKLGLAEDDRIETLLQIYNTSPATLTKAQRDMVNFHRYTNDLMTSEEEAWYESTQQSQTS